MAEWEAVEKSGRARGGVMLVATGFEGKNNLSQIPKCENYRLQDTICLD